jgi:hypothetical protein
MIYFEFVFNFIKKKRREKEEIRQASRTHISLREQALF